MSSVLDRRDKQIWDAIEHDNWKQALQLCQKRIKKGEKGEYLLALRAYILAHGPSSSQVSEARSEIVALASREPPVTDVNTLRLAQEAASISSGVETTTAGRDVSSMWERAVKAHPKDEELPKEWFLTAFQANNWRDAQKAAMVLQKAFPKTREYFFWAILCSYLLYISPDSSDADRNLFGMLAYRMISKAASDVPSDPNDLLSSPRAIQTSEELQLLVSIYRRQGRSKEALDLLNSEKLGIHSRVAKGGWRFVREKLDLLEEQKLWREEFEYCRSLIDKACLSPDNTRNGSSVQVSDVSGDDWRIWQGLATASRELDGEPIAEAVSRYQAIEQKSRNTHLGLVLLSSFSKSAPGGILAFCKEYFARYSRTLACFEDLKIFVENFDSETKVAFKSYILEQACHSLPENSSEKDLIDSLTSKITTLKFEYMLEISAAETPSKSSLENFAIKCMKIYRSSWSLGQDMVLTDNKPGDDACLLAMMSLVRLARIQDSSSSISRVVLLQISALLESLAERSKHNYQALLLLVRTYLLQGATSLAITTYPRLAIKQIQNDTVAHNLFTRLSTIHPLPILSASRTLERPDIEPYAAFERLLQVYHRSDTQLPVFKKLALEHGSYNQIQEFCQFEDRMSSSICKWMWTLEKRRVGRLLDIKSRAVGGEFQLTKQPQDILSDNRDFDVLVNFETTTSPRFEKYLRVGPKPKDLWVKSQVYLDNLFKYLNGELPSAEFLKSSSSLKSSDDQAEKELTSSEEYWTEVPALISNILIDFSSKDGSPEEKADRLRSKVESIIARVDMADQQKDIASITSQLSLDARLDVDWTLFHESFVAFEHLKLLGSFQTFLKKEIKKPSPPLSEALKRLAASIDGAYEKIRKRAFQVKNRLSESGVIGSMVDEVLGKADDHQTALGTELETVLQEPWVETFIGNVVDSWQEALDGLLRIKLK